MKAHGYKKLPRTTKGIQYAGMRIANQSFHDFSEPCRTTKACRVAFRVLPAKKGKPQVHVG